MIIELPSTLISVSQQDSNIQEHLLGLCCIGHLVSGVSGWFSWSLPSVSHCSIFIKVHPLLMKKCVKCVMLTGSGFTKHQMEHGQLSHGLCVLVWEAEGLKGVAVTVWFHQAQWHSSPWHYFIPHWECVRVVVWVDLVTFPWLLGFYHG